ncbi:MAG: hypothetical protein RLZZ617_668, partial [Bacteroidota bacterium]
MDDADVKFLGSIGIAFSGNQQTEIGMRGQRTT